MLRLTLNEALKRKGWTAYRLARETGIPRPMLYRLAKQGYEVKRLDVANLEKICKALDIHPCKLLDYQPD